MCVWIKYSNLLNAVPALYLATGLFHPKQEWGCNTDRTNEIAAALIRSTQIPQWNMRRFWGILRGWKARRESWATSRSDLTSIRPYFWHESDLGVLSDSPPKFTAKTKEQIHSPKQLIFNHFRPKTTDFWYFFVSKCLFYAPYWIICLVIHHLY